MYYFKTYKVKDIHEAPEHIFNQRLEYKIEKVMWCKRINKQEYNLTWLWKEINYYPDNASPKKA